LASLTGSQEIAGSIPVSPTINFPALPLIFWCLVFCSNLGFLSIGGPRDGKELVPTIGKFFFG
jgi:hypothetical protein